MFPQFRNTLKRELQRFIFDSYACRTGKGTHAALDRFQTFCRRHRYVLQCDVQKFFPSMDHEILMERIRRVVKDPDVIWLCRLIIDHSNPQEPVDAYFPGDNLFTVCERRRGLPIGNQTSQFFANVYLDPLDHFAKETLRCRAYLRYVDDFLLCADDCKRLREWKTRLGVFLAGLRIRLHRAKCQVFPANQGTCLLGFRVFPTHRRLTKDGVRRCRIRLYQMQREFELGLLSPPELGKRLNAWIGHARHGQTWRLRARLFDEYRFSRKSQTQVSDTG